jgi:MoaA/NifB/PqqE/SkfB family radical SAM enzyme
VDFTIPAGLRHMRPYALDGAMLLFDRDTGLNALLDGPETAHLVRRAPRVLQFALTNHCNLACTFCSRDVDAESDWTLDAVVTFLSEMAAHGVLEVAFGGGEPLVFKRFAELVLRLYAETPLAISFTTNGTLLHRALLERLAGKIGQLRLSIYDDADWRAQVRMLADARARFGINYLVTPARAATLTDTVLELVELGAHDVLLLSYNGDDRSLHLSRDALAKLDAAVTTLHRALRGRAELKLDVCWGDRLPSAPRAIEPEHGCGAGRDSLVITSDRKVQPCSFHHRGFAFATADEVMDIWRREAAPMRAPTAAPGCAREPGFGLERATRRLPLAMETVR